MRSVCVAVLGILLPLAAHGVQDFTWSGRVEPGAAVEIRGISGMIEAVASDGDQVEVVATRFGDPDDVERVSFDVIEDRDGVVVCALYPIRHRSRRHRDRGCRRHGSTGGDIDDLDVDVEFVVRVPSGVGFTGHLVSGEISATGLDAEVEAATVSGDIRISTTDVASANTVSGSIEASLGRTDWSGSLRFNSVSGDITVALPDNPSLDVRFNSLSGDIQSDFPLTIQGRRSFVGSNLRGAVGGGGPELRINTVSGDLRLLKKRS